MPSTPTYENEYFQTYASPVRFSVPDDVKGNSYLIDVVIFDKDKEHRYNHMELWSDSKELMSMYFTTMCSKGWIFQAVEPDESAYAHYDKIHGEELPDPAYYCVFTPPHEQIETFGEDMIRHIKRLH